MKHTASQRRKQLMLLAALGQFRRLAAWLQVGHGDHGLGNDHRLVAAPA